MTSLASGSITHLRIHEYIPPSGLLSRFVNRKNSLVTPAEYSICNLLSAEYSSFPFHKSVGHGSGVESNPNMPLCIDGNQAPLAVDTIF